MSEPMFKFRDKTPEEWQAWADGLYEDLDRNAKYLMADDFARQGIVGDYALSTPYEWYGDNFLAYVVTVLEEEALAQIADDANAKTAAMTAVDDALRAIWPTFYHRNLAPDVRRYFEQTFRISVSDRRHLNERYLAPLIQMSAGAPQEESRATGRLGGVPIWLILGGLAAFGAIALWRFRRAQP